MSFLILALLILAGSAAAGHRQGAIRAGISLIGIVISAELAWPFSGIIRPLVSHLGVHNPVAIWMVPPFIVFCISLSVFKSVALLVNRKANVHYRYHRDDVAFIMWNKMNQWLGLCVGTVNGMIYLALISFVIYDFSYWTVQVASSDQEKWEVRLLNSLGEGLESTGMNRIAQAINPLPEIYFKTADLAGLIYQNQSLSDRLASYPPFLSLSEQGDFKALGQDAGFQDAWRSRAPIGQLLNNGDFKTIWENTGTREQVWDIVRTNLDDLQTYLQTGKSAKYDKEPILGRWDVNVIATLDTMVQASPNISSTDMAAMRKLWTPPYTNTVFIAGGDGQAFLDNLPHLQVQPNGHPPTFNIDSWQGQWNDVDGSYTVSLSGSGTTKSATGIIDGSRLTLRWDSDTLVLDKE